MLFAKPLPVDTSAVLAALGYRNTPPDKRTALLLGQAASEIETTSTARYGAARFSFLAIPQMDGADIAAHLAGCTVGYLLAVTLGQGVETAIRRAEAIDMERAVLLDGCASALAEQYADKAEHVLRTHVETSGEYLTGRFSPGYGDFPLSFQKDLIRLLDAPRSIGLSVSTSGILLPRKSITAVLGVASHPVTGHLAECKNCKLFEKCQRRKDGNFCGKPPV